MSTFPFPIQIPGNNKNYINSTEHTIHHHDVFIDADIEEPENYRELISLLFNAGEGDTIHIFINSSGGNLDTALSIVEGLKSTNATVTAFILGACHSAASIISMYCHNFIVLDSAYSMIHTASGGSYGTVSNSASHAAFIHDKVEKLLNETYEGFLTKDELLNVKKGVELWFDAEQIRERMKNRVKYLETKWRKLQKEIKQ